MLKNVRRKKNIQDHRRLTEVIEPIHVQQFLKISKNASYDLMKSKQFHVVKIGRLYKAPKEAFIEWVEGKMPVQAQPQEKARAQLQKSEICHACPLYALFEKGITLTLKVEAKK